MLELYCSIVSESMLRPKSSKVPFPVIHVNFHYVSRYAIFKSRNSTSMMNFPVNGTSIDQMKSSLFLSCLSVTSVVCKVNISLRNYKHEK
ncbi:hypothetical protein ACJIZ3_007064 [Penstemon smallii]|uniref:Uncharacterized protein n=1 Tax=Penstemon smallii TaxID=265156 RepID=A0ABD3S9J5_9LAMI